MSIQYTLYLHLSSPFNWQDLLAMCQFWELEYSQIRIFFESMAYLSITRRTCTTSFLVNGEYVIFNRNNVQNTYNLHQHFRFIYLSRNTTWLQSIIARSYAFFKSKIKARCKIFLCPFLIFRLSLSSSHFQRKWRWQLKYWKRNKNILHLVFILLFKNA